MDNKKRFLGPVTRLRALVVLLGFLTMTLTDAHATTYYSVANGGWTSNVWGSCSTCTAGNLPALVDGDIIIIDNQVTIAGGNLNIAARVTIIVRTDFSPNTTLSPAKLIFTGGGKLNLQNPGSSVVLENATGGSNPNPVIDGTGSGNSNTIVVNGVTFWSTSMTETGDLTGVGTLGPGGALPIKLISFAATDLGNSVQLKWVTALERNFSHFELEKSTGNLTFIPIAHIEGKGGLDVITSYIYIDSLPQSGKNYYRLKAVDYDLAFEYSPVVVAESKTEKEIVVYPNPAIGGSINVRTNFSPQEGDRIEIYNSLGLKLQEFNVIEYENVLPFNDTIKQGSYLLRYVSPTYSSVIRFYSN